MTGLELAQQIFRQRPKMPVILATGFSGEWTLEKVRAFGVRDLIAKPMTITTLAITIQRALLATKNEE
jgi:FixJ family two-component response regulator